MDRLPLRPAPSSGARKSNRRRGTLVALASALLLVAIQPLAADDDADAIIQKVQKKYESIQDASVTFTRHIQFGAMKAEQEFKGTMLMKRGDKYRIELEDQTIVTDGKSVWSFNTVNRQLLIDKYKDDPNGLSPDKVLVNIPEQYSAALLGTEKIGEHEASILKLIPRSQKTSTQWMKVWVDRDDWLMRRIQVFDVSENLTTYDVTTFRINPGVADSLFQFSAPPGVDVIDLR